MTDVFDLLIRQALHALAMMYGAGRVVLQEVWDETRQSRTLTVHVDVTEYPLERNALAAAILPCIKDHQHDDSCYPWRVWQGRMFNGTYRCMTGKLLTMVVELEETLPEPGPVPSDPATEPVPTEPHNPWRMDMPHEPATWLDPGNGPGVSRPRIAEPEQPIVPEPGPAAVVRPFVLAAEEDRRALLARYPTDLLAEAAALVDLVRDPAALAREVNATLPDPVNPGLIVPVNPGLTPEVNDGLTGFEAPAAPLLALLDDGPTTRELEQRYASRPDVHVVSGTDPHAGAWRAWARETILGELRRSTPHGYFASYDDALAAVRAHPARDTIEPDDVELIARQLVYVSPEIGRKGFLSFLRAGRRAAEVAE